MYFKAKVLTAVIVLIASGAFAMEATLETGESIFPSRGTAWTFTDKPFALRQITEKSGQKNFLSSPAGLILRNGKTAAFLEPGKEAFYSGKNYVCAIQDYPGSINIKQHVLSHDDSLFWEVIVRNNDAGEAWLDMSLRLPVAPELGESYWDGFELHGKDRFPVVRTKMLNTFPVAYLFDGNSGLCLGMPPAMETSYLENGVDSQGRMFYGTRVVLAPGQEATIRFVLYNVAPISGYRDAVHGYYRRFPASFAPADNTDPRLTSGRRIDSLQVCHYGNGIDDANKAVKLGESNSGYEWGYCMYRRGGDFYVRPEYWDMPLTEGMLKTIDNLNKKGSPDRTDMNRFVDERREMFRNADLRGNSSLCFYILNYIEKDLAERLGVLDYTYPPNKSIPALRSGWGLPYNSQYHIFPWATPFEQIVKRDIPEVLRDLDTYGIAFDCYGNYEENTNYYRGSLDYFMPGWSYDEEGKYIARSLGFRKLTEYFHTLKKDGKRIAVWANGISQPHPLCHFAPDLFMSEDKYVRMLEEDNRRKYLHYRIFAGHKPVDHHSYASNVKLGDYLPWETMSPEEIRSAYDDFIRDYVVFLYQAGQMPSRHTIGSHQVVSDELPFLLDVLPRGYEPVPGSKGEAVLERVRYGDGLGAVVVSSNRTAEPVTTDEAFNNAYIGNFTAVPFNLRGGDMSFKLEGQISSYRIDVKPLENALTVFPLALRLSEAAAISGRSTLTRDAVSITYTASIITENDGGAMLFVKADHEYEIVAIEVNGKPVGKARQIALTKGENKIEVATKSKLFKSGESELTSFPFADAVIVLPDGANPRTAATAQALQDFFEIRLKKKPEVTGAVPSDRPAIMLSDNPEFSERGCWCEGNILRISGCDAFDLQQNAWLFMRFLERYGKNFSPRKETQYGSGEATRSMLRKAGWLNQWIPAVQTAKRVPWNSYRRNSEQSTTQDAAIDVGKLKRISAVRTAVAPVVDGKLDDEIWKSAQPADDFKLLNLAGEEPTQKASVKLVYTDDTLYVGFVCHERDMDKTFAQIKQRDGMVWLDDDFELRLGVGVPPEAASYKYYVFLLNSINTQMDSENNGQGIKWDAVWTSAVHKDETFWSGEIAIPLAAIPGGESKTWRVNFSRAEKPNSEFSSWASMDARTVDNPSCFGVLEFK
jgi:hypothetical protein